MSKPTLSVPGIDPARIECVSDGEDQVVICNGVRVAHKLTTGFPICLWFAASIPDELAVMNAAIDHWRATGRLFPEPPPEPVECVCGILAKAGTTPDDRTFVICKSPTCYLRANTVEQWNIMQAALKSAKAAKEGK